MEHGRFWHGKPSSSLDSSGVIHFFVFTLHNLLATDSSWPLDRYLGNEGNYTSAKLLPSHSGPSRTVLLHLL